MPITVRTPETHEFDLMVYGERTDEGDWVIKVDEVDSDGGLFHYPRDLMTEYDEDVMGDVPALTVIAAIGDAEASKEWDDLTPASRTTIIRLWKETE